MLKKQRTKFNGFVLSVGIFVGLATTLGLSEDSKINNHQYKIAFLYSRLDKFWRESIRYASAAATDVGIELLTIKTGGDQVFTFKEVERLCNEGIDGIIFNAADVDGEKLLQITEKYDVPTFLINVDIRGTDFYPRTKYRSWKGKMLPDDQQAGAILIEQLIRQARSLGGRELHVLAIEGTGNDVDASVLRRRGLDGYLQYLPDVDSFVAVRADWDPEKAAKAFESHYRSNSKINVVWVANDNMALAVTKKISQMGIASRIFVGGIDWNNEAMKAVGRGELAVSVGGHFLEAAWAVVLLHDYLKGKDFANEGVSFVTRMSAVTKENYDQVESFFRTMPGELDFRKISKVANPGLLRYNFDFLETINAISEASGKGLSLRQEEKEWLQSQPTLRFGYDYDWAPIESANADGTVAGLSISYLEHIKGVLGLDIVPMPPVPWKQMLKLAEAGEIDVMSAVARTPEREKYLDFTEPYLTFPVVVVTRKEVAYIASMQQLDGRSVAVVENYFVHHILQKNHPRILIRPCKGVREGILSVLNGDNYAYVDTLTTVGEVISREGIGDVKVSGETPYNFELCMGVKKGNDKLLDLIQKALKSISEQQKENFYRNWFRLTYEHKIDYSKLWKYFVAFFAIITITLYWNRKLSSINRQLVISRNKVAEHGRELARKNAQMCEELVLAGKVQKSIYPPLETPLFLKMAVRYVPYAEVSGDIYFIHSLTQGSFDLFLGDATGHGVTAAFLTIMADVVLTDKANEKSITKILQALNEVLQLHTPGDKFLTGVYMRIMEDGRLICANAGHPVAIVVPADGSPAVPLAQHGELLGIFTDIDCPEQQYELKYGDKIFIYTDGVVEYGTKQGELYGIQKLTEFVTTNSSFDVETILAKLMDDLRSFAKENPPSDDVTIIALEYQKSADA